MSFEEPMGNLGSFLIEVEKTKILSPRLKSKLGSPEYGRESLSIISYSLKISKKKTQY